MSVSALEISEIRNYLKLQHIVTSSEWIEACILFVKDEHQGQNISIQNLKKYVYQQWLVADLEEIAVSSLPQDLPIAQKVTLNGNFALQVEGIRDISRPAYAELNQLENRVNPNEEFSAAPKAAVPEWEAKPTRMLMMNLTDGCIHIQGMEYKTISILSPNLPPGVKVLINGPVECRFGVLLLTPEKISVLGGEVEHKLQKFSRVAMLKEALQLPNNSENEETAGGNVNNIDVVQQMSATSCNSRPSNPVGPQNSASQNPNLRNNLFNVQETVHRNRMNYQNRENSDNMDHFESDDDDFAQNIDYGLIDEIENSQKAMEPVVPKAVDDEYDIWNEDEDIVNDIMAFQEENPVFEIPAESSVKIKLHASDITLNKEYLKDKPFSYLSSVINNPSFENIITIKAFIINVLSKLECTYNKGWSLMVKINDGTASIDASIHDKVLETIIGVPAPVMVKMQLEAATNMDKRREVVEAISKCKITLQNYNCLMDVKFCPGDKPCIIKCYPVNQQHIEQLINRVRSTF